jgi:formate/nitrite transporter FocA (FNT family)
VPLGLLIKNFDPLFSVSANLDLSGLTWTNFLINNLLPVTIGNIIGGSVFVAVIYWSVFLRRKPL